MIKAIIFDLDGVIVHTDHYHYLAWKHLADSLNIEFNEEINHQLRGVSRMASLDIILTKHTQTLTWDEKEKLANKKNDLYCQYLSRLKPSDVDKLVVETLHLLKRKGYLLAIGSSSKNAKYILSQIQLTSLFDVISDGTNITQSKPDPEVFLKAALGLNVEPQTCLVVEDATAGIDAANRANMKACGIGPASNYDKSDYKISHLSELIDILSHEQ